MIDEWMNKWMNEWIDEWKDSLSVDKCFKFYSILGCRIRSKFTFDGQPRRRN